MSVSQAVSIAFSHNPSSAIAQQFTGADQFTGSNFGDVLAGFGGNDYLNGRDGVGSSGRRSWNDTLLGGARQ